LRAGLADASFAVALAAGIAAVFVYPKGPGLTLSVGPLGGMSGAQASARVSF
jgi:hypothetical protein